jgi:hypothetical protein
MIRTMEEPTFFQKYSMVIQYLLIVDDTTRTMHLQRETFKIRSRKWNLQAAHDIRYESRGFTRECNINPGLQVSMLDKYLSTQR